MNEIFLKNINKMVRRGEFLKAIATLDETIAETPCDDTLYEIRGRIHWRIGNHTMAMSDYSKAVALNEKSPARHLLEMAQSVTDFFNPDLLNP